MSSHRQGAQTQRVPFTRSNLKKSSMFSDLDRPNKPDTTTPRSPQRHLTYSSVIGSVSQDILFHSSNLKSRQHQNDPLQEAQEELKRAKSVRSSQVKKNNPGHGEKNTNEELQENVLRLRVEEITYKIKARIGSIVKQLNLGPHLFVHFSTLNKIDEILDFLSEKVREKLLSFQLSQASLSETRTKEKTLVNQKTIEIDSLRKKLQEKDGTQKQLKVKLRQSQNQARQQHQKVSTKERELSSKMTELYHAKTAAKESEKIIEHLNDRNSLLEKEISSYKQKFEADNMQIVNINKEIEQENTALRDKNQELEEELLQLGAKIHTLQEMNSQLSQELTRWRQRFEDGSFGDEEKSKKSTETNPPQSQANPLGKDLKKSTMSMKDYTDSVDNNPNNAPLSLTALQIQNRKLETQVQQLSTQNRQLAKKLLNFAVFNEVFQQMLNGSESKDKVVIEGLSTKERLKYFRMRLKQLAEHQLQAEYKVKMEEAATEWKQKLVQLVNKYEDQLQQIKDSSEEAEKQLQERLFEMSNEKYKLQKQIIGLQKQIYELLKAYKSLSGSSSPLNYKPLEAEKESPSKQTEGLEEYVEGK